MTGRNQHVTTPATTSGTRPAVGSARGCHGGRLRVGAAARAARLGGPHRLAAPGSTAAPAHPARRAELRRITALVNVVTGDLELSATDLAVRGNGLSYSSGWD